MGKKILYIGNQLSGKGRNVSTIDTLGSQLREEGFRMVTASSKQNMMWRMLDMLYAVVQYRKEASFVLIDTYSTSAFWYAFFTSQLCRLFGLKYIPILHGGNLPYRVKNNPWLSRLIFKNAYRSVAPSNYLKYEFESAGYNNIVHIPNTIELQNYLYKERKDIQPKLLWVRAFAGIYNPKMAIDVLNKLRKNYPEAELCMVGPDKDGSLEKTKNYAQSLDLKVTFTGGLSKQEWILLSQKYDVFINTTHFDNTPVSVIEAMALGLPVVSTNVGGIPFLLDVGNDSFLVNDNDLEMMVVKIEFLMKNPDEVSRLTGNALQKAKHFDWHHVKKDWLALLNESK
ncbi:glycosyltransferase family 4 protein [Flavobacterium sp. H122]|uniref:glycosyltransferase family 4 protein n=1 Tax=Flavobacterium sp. H122 TaxID=2529860 RepID=UPI00352DFBD4